MFEPQTEKTSEESCRQDSSFRLFTSSRINTPTSESSYESWVQHTNFKSSHTEDWQIVLRMEAIRLISITYRRIAAISCTLVIPQHHVFSSLYDTMTSFDTVHSLSIDNDHVQLEVDLHAWSSGKHTDLNSRNESDWISLPFRYLHEPSTDAIHEETEFMSDFALEYGSLSKIRFRPRHEWAESQHALQTSFHNVSYSLNEIIFDATRHAQGKIQNAAALANTFKSPDKKSICYSSRVHNHIQ